MNTITELHRSLICVSGGRIIWQPRISCLYSEKIYTGGPLPEPYQGMNIAEIYRSLGCSARLYEFYACFCRIEHTSVTFSEQQINETETQIIIETPMGKQLVINRHPNRSEYNNCLTSLFTFSW